MEICLCVDHWSSFYPLQGTVRYVQTLAQGLVAWGHRVHILTPHPSIDSDFEEDGCLIHSRVVSPIRMVSRFQHGLGESLGVWRALGRLLRDHPIDVVEFTNWEGIGAVTATFTRVPTVIRLHTTAYDTIRMGIGKPRLERHYARLECWTARRASALATHSTSHQTQVAADYQVPRERIAVIPAGVKPLTPTNRGSRNPRQVLTVSSATPRKGVAIFLAVADQVARALPDCRFVWVGEDTATAPEGKTWAQHCANRYPHLKNVRFVGACSDEQLADYYAESAVYLCTSRYESFGLTLVEAMHAGLPVVAPRAAAMAELVRAGQTGCLYEPGNAEECSAALQDLMRKPSDSQAMGECGQVVAQREYSVDRMTGRVLDLYRSVC